MSKSDSTEYAAMSSEQRLNKGSKKMYRILIADDEGLMLEAFKGVILAEFEINAVWKLRKQEGR